MKNQIEQYLRANNGLIDVGIGLYVEAEIKRNKVEFRYHRKRAKSEILGHLFFENNNIDVTKANGNHDRETCERLISVALKTMQQNR
ncbi:TPA: hypothetical protein NK990_003894 [Vibrio parahaemolyticus]|nr:hypothetical protein [Vibrio parahaemolyticus]